MVNDLASTARRLGVLALGAVLAACNADEASDARGNPGSEEALDDAEQALSSSVSIRRGVSGTVADAYVSAATPKKRFGDAKRLMVGEKDHALLSFDLSAILAGAHVKRATLTVTGRTEEEEAACTDESEAGGPLQVRRVTAGWSEDSVTYRSFDQQLATEVEATLVLGCRRSTTSVDVTALVEGWVAGTYPNHGLALTTQEKQESRVLSSEHDKVRRRPRLEVEYTTADDPEPPATSSLTVTDGPGQAFVGDTVTVRTALARASAPVGAVAGAPVVFEISRGALPTTVVTIPTGPNGDATLVLAPTERGAWHVAARFEGSDALAKSSTATDFSVFQKTQLIASPVVASPIAAATFSAGLVAMPQGTPITGQTVGFDFFGVIAPLSAVTDEQGIASAYGIVPTPGTYSMTVTFENLDDYFVDGAGEPLAASVSTQVNVHACPAGYDQLGDRCVLVPYLPNVAAVGEAVRFAGIGSNETYWVTMLDVNNHPLVPSIGCERVTATIEDDSGQVVRPTCLDLENGVFEMRYALSASGRYTHRIMVDGVDIPSSPFALSALP